MGWTARGTSLRQRRAAVASWTALGVVSAGLAWFAWSADGQAVHRVDLHDGGVWVTNQAIGAIARENKPISQLDTYVDAATSMPDVLQHGAAVVAVDASTHTLTPVSASQGKALTDDPVTPAGPASLRGGTLAAIAPDTGKLWAVRVDPGADVLSLAGLDREAEPITQVGPDAHAVAATTGDVFAVSAASSRIATVPAEGAALGAPGTSRLGAEPEDGIAALSAVGDTPVVLDGAGAVISGSRRVEVGNGAVLQQPGPDAGEVLVASREGLVAVSLDSGGTRALPAGSGQPSAPVRVGKCLFAAWVDGTTGRIVSECDGQDAVGPVDFEVAAGAELVFRVNRNTVVLNDVRNGHVWSLESAKPVEIADWESLMPRNPDKKQSDEEKVDSREIRQKPQARDDDLGARPGRTTTLHVLDNDLVSGGGVLSVVSVGRPSSPAAQVQMTSDRQAVLLTVPEGVASVTFEYTISDGTGGKDSTDTGRVTVVVRSDVGAAAPTRLENVDEKTYSLAAGGSVEISPVGEWRDREYGDPISLDGVEPPRGVEARLTPEGLVSLQAAGATGRVQVPYVVSTDGAGATQARGTILLNVLGPRETRAVPPQAQADVASGESGSPITIRPLENDIPGADPTEPRARLELGGQVPPTGGLQVRTDLETGEVTIRAQAVSKPTSYTLQYAAAYGSARFSKAQIRVEVTPPSQQGDTPIAAPDEATIRGRTPLVVDVLANDHDPRGQMLTVQEARPLIPEGGLEVAIIKGRWLRVGASTDEMAPASQAVTYTISNGTAMASGTVTVTQKPPLAADDNVPIAEDDEVTVRVGDSATVPVLDNDATPAGDPVGLRVPMVDGTPMGELQVQPRQGRAFVSGRNVRYVAPEEVDGPTTLAATYVVENTADPQRPSAAGALTIRVNPEPSEDNPNQPPTPRLIEARVVEGDTTSLQLPLVGNDPDGDSVTITGIGSPPSRGRLLSYGANTLVYQAFPGARGTDEFTYVVADRYGSTAEGTVRVAVTPPPQPQAPAAVDDVVTAAPGRTVELDLLANDLRTPGTRLRVLPLRDSPKRVRLDEETGLLVATAPIDPREPVVVPYQVSNGLEESSAQITVRSRKGFNNPPFVADAYAEPDPESTSVVVEVLEKAYDIDGQGEPVEVEWVGHSDATVSDGEVALPVTDTPQVVPFRVVDGEGATAAAVIYVPARPTGAPYLRPDAEIVLEPGETRDVPVEELVADPEDDTVVLTLADRIVGAPTQRIEATAPDKDNVLRVSATDDTGPGVVTFEVSDRADLGDPKAHVVTLSVPVIVGDGEPILSCPDQVLQVVEGGESKVVDVASICHVWTPDPEDAADLSFTARWAEGRAVRGVAVDNTADGLRLQAGSDASRGHTGLLEVTADGSSATGTLLVEVVAAGPPSLQQVSVEGRAGEPVTVDLAGYASSPFGSEAAWILVDEVARLSTPAPVEVTTRGAEVTMTPSKAGVYTFGVTLADDGGVEDSQRPRATSRITLSVVSEPDAPSAVRWDGRTRDGQVRLLWDVPAANGGSIDGYTVRYSGGSDGSQSCAANDCVITGLRNGQQYRFWVTAHNQYGDSPESAPTTGKPDRVPDQVAGLRVVHQHDRAVRLEWQPPRTAGEYSTITDYYVKWRGSGGGVSTGGRRQLVAQLDSNGVLVDFEVWAQNASGNGPSTAVRGQGAGKPGTPTMKPVQTANRAGRTRKAVTLSWGAVDPNGPAPVTYEVVRVTSGGGTTVVCAWQQATSCEDDLANDGTVHAYKVRARNQEAVNAPGEAGLHESGFSAAANVEAAAPPEGVRNLSLVATGRNNEGRARFDLGPSHGKVNRIECRPSCGNLAQTSVNTSGKSGIELIVSSPNWTNGSSRTLEVRACNGSSGSGQTGSSCSAWVGDATTPYGPIPKPELTVNVTGACLNWKAKVWANGKAVKPTLMVGGTELGIAAPGWGAVTTSGRRCDKWSTSRAWSLTVDDSSTNAEQPTPRASAKVSFSRKTNGPHAPTEGAYDETADPKHSKCDPKLHDCRYVKHTIKNYPPGDFGYCMIHHVGTWRQGQDWWYRTYHGANADGFAHTRHYSWIDGRWDVYPHDVYPAPIVKCAYRPPAGANVDKP